MNKLPTALNSFAADKKLLRKIGIRIDGVDQGTDVHAYDSVQGWIRYIDGSMRYGKVEPYWRKS